MQTSLASNVVHHMSSRFPSPMERMNNNNNQASRKSVVHNVETLDLISNKSNNLAQQQNPVIQSRHHNNGNNYNNFITELTKRQFIQNNNESNKQRRISNDLSIHNSRIIGCAEAPLTTKDISTLNQNKTMNELQQKVGKDPKKSISSTMNNHDAKFKSQKQVPSQDEPKHCVLELPAHVKAGDRIIFAWPGTENEKKDGVDESPSIQSTFAIIVPKCFPDAGVVRKDPISGNEIPERRFIRIISPDAEAPAITPSMRKHAQMKAKSRNTRKSSRSKTIVTNDKKDKEWNTDSEMNIRWKEYKKISSRIGKNYQATNIPKCGTYNEERKNKKDAKEDDSETLWNSQKARCAIYHGQNVTKFIESLPTNQKYLGMEALHRKKYIVEDAKSILETHIQIAGPEVQGCDLSTKEAFQFDESIRKHQKNFLKIADEISKSVATTLVHYYKNIKPGPKYRSLRLLLHSDLNECQICGEGGNLICCDSCASPYHLGCVELGEVPDGNWFCPKCVRKGNNSL